MPIPLNRHAKIWIHPDGIIPDKIYQRLLFQREVRPNDSLTLFVNEACIFFSGTKIPGLLKSGVTIKIIETNLSERTDHPYLVGFINAILQKLKKTKDVKDSVFASDFLRMTNMVQDAGLYSDTDVLFLNRNNCTLISTTHLFGHHNDKTLPDIHIFGIDSYTRAYFHEKLVEAMMAYYGETVPDTESERLSLMPGIYFIQYRDALSTENHGHLDFLETEDNVLSGLDFSHAGGEEKLHSKKDEDAFLALAKKIVISSSTPSTQAVCTLGR